MSPAHSAACRRFGELYALTKERRRAVCVHEAGHAVAHALGGAHVCRVAVAPEGAAAWTIATSRGTVMTDLWGVCEPLESNPASGFLRWDDDEGCLQADRPGFRSYLRQIGGLGAGVRREVLRHVRACLCASVAGPIAEQIHNGEEPEIDYEGSHFGRDDGNTALALARLLPWRNELEFLHAQTVLALRRPEVWAMVVRLADELERVGELEYEKLSDYLPEPLAHWPPSPKARTGAG